MKIVIQRVLKAKVLVNNEEKGSIDEGLLLYACFERGDTIEMVQKAVSKILKYRIFNDSDGKMNLDIKQKEGGVLSISQFTLSWDGKKGHRPSFDKSMPPNEAKIYYRKFNDLLEESGLNIAKGVFGAEMEVESINDGPVTFFLEY